MKHKGLLASLATLAVTLGLLVAPPAAADDCVENPCEVVVEGSSQTFTLPADTIKYEIWIYGASGGSGGTDCGLNCVGEPGANGSLVVFSSDIAVSVYRDSFEFTAHPGGMGSPGTMGECEDCGTPGGAGGVSTYSSSYNGGNGGSSGPLGFSGSGGGGGAATVVTGRTNSGQPLVAAGGGGGGGHGYCPGNATPGSATFQPAPLSGSNGASVLNDGGGGGGGGGGIVSGAGGGLSKSDDQRYFGCEEPSGLGGFTGQSSAASSSERITTSVQQRPTPGPGKVVFKYWLRSDFVAPQFDFASVVATPASVYPGESTTVTFQIFDEGGCCISRQVGVNVGMAHKFFLNATLLRYENNRAFYSMVVNIPNNFTPGDVQFSIQPIDNQWNRTSLVYFGSVKVLERTGAEITGGPQVLVATYPGNSNMRYRTVFTPANFPVADFVEGKLERSGNGGVSWSLSGFSISELTNPILLISGDTGGGSYRFSFKRANGTWVFYEPHTPVDSAGPKLGSGLSESQVSKRFSNSFTGETRLLQANVDTRFTSEMIFQQSIGYEYSYSSQNGPWSHMFERSIRSSGGIESSTVNVPDSSPTMWLRPFLGARDGEKQYLPVQAISTEQKELIGGPSLLSATNPANPSMNYFMLEVPNGFALNRYSESKLEVSSNGQTWSEQPMGRIENLRNPTRWTSSESPNSLFRFSLRTTGGVWERFKAFRPTLQSGPMVNAGLFQEDVNALLQATVDQQAKTLAGSLNTKLTSKYFYQQAVGVEISTESSSGPFEQLIQQEFGQGDSVLFQRPIGESITTVYLRPYLVSISGIRQYGNVQPLSTGGPQVASLSTSLTQDGDRYVIAGVIESPKPLRSVKIACGSAIVVSFNWTNFPNSYSHSVQVLGSTLGSGTSSEVSGSASRIQFRSTFALPSIQQEIACNWSTELGDTAGQNYYSLQGLGRIPASANSTAIQQELKTWAKRLPGNNQAKLYAKSVVGAGKVSFRLNGREIAWVRAIDATDPKLRVVTSGPMSGANYLVRTVNLARGKNVLEVYVDGVRTTRTAYTK